MRNEVESRSKQGQLIKNAIEQGEIVPPVNESYQVSVATEMI